MTPDPDAASVIAGFLGCSLGDADELAAELRSFGLLVAPGEVPVPRKAIDQLMRILLREDFTSAIDVQCAATDALPDAIVLPYLEPYDNRRLDSAPSEPTP